MECAKGDKITKVTSCKTNEIQTSTITKLDNAWAPSLVGKFGGGGAKEILTIITKYFKKSSIVSLISVGIAPSHHGPLRQRPCNTPCLFELTPTPVIL